MIKRRRRGEWQVVERGRPGVLERGVWGAGRTLGSALRDFANALETDHARSARMAAWLTQPRQRRVRIVLPFKETVIPPGASVDVIAIPASRFTPQRLLIPSDIAGLLVIEDIRIGVTSQLSGSGPASIPARVFSEVAVGIGCLFDTAEPGMSICLRVRNQSSNEVVFRAVMEEQRDVDEDGRSRGFVIAPRAVHNAILGALRPALPALGPASV